MTRRELVQWLEDHPLDLLKMALKLWPVQAGIITAEDAVQEGLRRVFKTENYRALRSGVKITSWLMKSVASAALNAADKRSSREQPGGDPIGAEVAHGNGHGDDLGTLPEPDEYAFHERDDEIDEEDAAEVAAEMETFIEEQGSRIGAQNGKRVWAKRPYQTWVVAGRVVATTDPKQTVGNLYTCREE